LNRIKLVIWLIPVESGISQDIVFTWEEELSKFTLGKDLVSFAAKILNKIFTVFLINVLTILIPKEFANLHRRNDSIVI